METKATYSIKRAAASMFVGLVFGGLTVLLCAVMLSYLNVNSLAVDDAIWVACVFFALVFAGYRAADPPAHGRGNAIAICVMVVVLLALTQSDGVTFTESIAFPRHWNRLWLFAIALPAPLIGATLRSARRRSRAGRSVQ